MGASFRQSQNITRRGSSTVTVLVATASFAAIMACLLFMVGTPDEPTTVVQPEAVAAVPPVVEIEAASVSQPLQLTQLVIEEEQAAEPQITAVAKTEAVAKTDTTSDIQAHLDAGEFGPAIELANQTADKTKRQDMMKRIAMAQIQAGEFQGALMSVRQADDSSSDSSDNTDAAADPSLAGGSQADFSELMQLIQTQTEGLWVDVDGDGGSMTPFNSGVMADPTALLPLLARVDTEGRLESLGLKARRAALNEQMAQPSNMRLVSLKRLQAAAAQHVADGTPIAETIQNMAGIHEVRYVFADAENNDILIGGPAGAWMYNENGQPVSTENGRPTLKMDDLVTVLRTFSHQGHGEFVCSIDPRQDGLQRLQAYVAKSNARGALRPNQTRGWVKALQRNLGMQDVRIEGVPTDSRIARVIFEADYRMKLIGIGKLEGVDGVKSFFDLLPKHVQQNPPSIDALRWWLTMNYESVLHSPNNDVFEISGSSVKCLSENEFLTAQGQRVPSGSADGVNKEFAERFTKHYQKLAERDIVFADLQNVFDLALVAALIRHEGLDHAVDFDRGVFANNGSYQPARYEPTSEVMSVVNHRVYNGKDIVVQVAGGVRGDVMKVVRDDAKQRTAASLTKMADRTQPTSNRWWWDAK